MRQGGNARRVQIVHKGVGNAVSLSILIHYKSSFIQCCQSRPNFCSRIFRAVADDNILLVVEILNGRQIAQEAVNILCGQETAVHIPADIEGASFDGSHAVVQVAVEVV